MQSAFGNVAPVTVTIVAAGYHLASPTIAQPEPVNFGNLHVGATVAAAALSLTNAAPTDGKSESLDASIGGLGAGQGGTSPVVTFNTGVTGTFTETIVLAGAGSNASGYSGAVASQTLTLTGTVSNTPAQLAQASAAAPNPVTLFARQGGVATQALSLANTAPTTGVSESLDASLGDATPGFTASGSVSLLAAGHTDDTHLVVGLDTSVAGVQSGTATLNLASDGQGTSGGGVTPLTPQTIALTGEVYATAVASAPTSVNFGIVHVGDTAAQAVTLGHTATGGLADVLTGGFGAVTGGFTGSGTLGAGVAAGGTGTLNLTLNTAAAGVYTGAAALVLASHDPSLSDVAVSAGPIALTGTVDSYAKAAFETMSGADSRSKAGTTGPWISARSRPEARPSPWTSAC